MHLSPYALWIPGLIALFVPIVAGLSSWRVISVQRANGRRAVEARLAALGEAPLSIERVPFSAVLVRTGLAGAVTVFRILARRPDGSDVNYEWAYEPALVARQPRSLKRLAHGIWIAIA
jgi:hypothetical protein